MVYGSRFTVGRKSHRALVRPIRELSTVNCQPDSWGLYVLTDRSLTKGRPLEVVVDAALQGGAIAIQLREKDLSARALYELAQRLLPIVHSRRAVLLVKDRKSTRLNSSHSQISY